MRKKCAKKEKCLIIKHLSQLKMFAYRKFENNSCLSRLPGGGVVKDGRHGTIISLPLVVWYKLMMEKRYLEIRNSYWQQIIGKQYYQYDAYKSDEQKQTKQRSLFVCFLSEISKLRVDEQRKENDILSVCFARIKKILATLLLPAIIRVRELHYRLEFCND